MDQFQRTRLKTGSQHNINYVHNNNDNNNKLLVWQACGDNKYENKKITDRERIVVVVFLKPDYFV